ncbi:MAG: hypothetical protein JWM28_974 [Chitinophagaceae bacterium]|nr:hypothetical protein [Chitinophagaceae bacterium]
MALTKKQKIEQRDKEICRQYLKPDWDGCAALEYFAARHYTDLEEKYRYKPKTSLHLALKEIEIAQSTLYGVLAPMAYHKDKVVAFLNLLNESNVYIGEEITDREKYVKSYLAAARSILNDITNNGYSFQCPSS